MTVLTGGTGNSDPILPWYRTQAEDAYLEGVARGFERPVVVILDPLFDQCHAIITEGFGSEFVAQHRSIAREDDIPSMLVGGWRQDSAKHFLRNQKGSSQIIDAIIARGDFAIFILDGNGPRWFNCPIPGNEPS